MLTKIPRCGIRKLVKFLEPATLLGNPETGKPDLDGKVEEPEGLAEDPLVKRVPE